MKKKLLISVCMLILISGIIFVSAAFPTYEDLTGSSQTSNFNKNLVVTMPSAASSDLLITVTVSASAIATVPGGWTFKGGAVRNNVFVNIYGRVSDGAEPGSYTWITTSNGRSAAQVHRLSNWGGTLDDYEISASTNGFSTNPNSNSLSPSWGAENTTWITTFGQDEDRTISGTPTNYGNTAQQTTSTRSVGSARRDFNTDPEDPGAFTIIATENWVAYTIGISPAGLGPAGYANKVINITGGKVNGVASANIAKVNGV